MIPKNLFHIWVGPEIPRWAWNSIFAFANMNSEFNPNIIHIKNNFKNIGQDDFNPNNFQIETNESCKVDPILVLLNTFHKAKTEGTFLNWKYNTFRNKLHCNSERVILSDLLRFELLYTYGGIYVDCDCFPVRPFDKKLLKKKQFFSTSYDPFSGTKRKFFFRDNFFMGSEPGHYIKWRYRDLPFNFLKGEMRWPCFNRHNIKRQSFFSGGLGFEFYKSYPQDKPFGYVDHFFARTWKNKKDNYQVETF